ncbi:tetratricopeptide repeat protein 9A isoform X1 [Nycticebus coucang]|uniref:tetratricopeptide repeat protein 9A isoform X1 n=1 Tax=Nycticebus coucang TaxID=9470 RepID=UPI00234D31E1|nr:tetratricopeptide repeat protein 9A isoform X1 [Nycticebus coucang]
MGKSRTVFVIDPPLLLASQASGSATITATSSRAAVSGTDSSGERGPCRRRPQVAGGGRAGRSAGGAEWGGREGGGDDQRRTPPTRSGEQPPAAGEENGRAGRQAATGGHGRGAACGARVRRPPLLNPGGRGGGSWRIAARGAPGRLLNGEEGLGGRGQGEPQPVRGRRGAAATAAAVRPGRRRRGPTAGPGWGGGRTGRAHPARARVQKPRGAVLQGQKIPRSHWQIPPGTAGAEGTAAEPRGTGAGLARGLPGRGHQARPPLGGAEQDGGSHRGRLLQQPGSLPAAG